MHAGAARCDQCQGPLPQCCGGPGRGGSMQSLLSMRIVKCVFQQSLRSFGFAMQYGPGGCKVFVNVNVRVADSPHLAPLRCFWAGFGVILPRIRLIKASYVAFCPAIR